MADPADGLHAAVDALWERANASMSPVDALDQARADYDQFTADNPPATGSSELDAALSAFRVASNEATRDLSLDARSLLLGAAALPQCANCPLSQPNQQ